MFYSPAFYEFQALSTLSTIVQQPVQINVKLPEFTKTFASRPEIDGVFEEDGKEWGVEVKSYPINDQALAKISTKYHLLNFKQIKVIAPEFSNHNNTNGINVECIPFNPDLKKIREFYYRIAPKLPSIFIEELGTGWHHFRYKLARRSCEKLTRFVNQTDKRIKKIEHVKNEIVKRTPKNNPPVRVYWSTGRWLSPKDLYYRNSQNYYLGGPLVFDVDGVKAHKPFVDCIITPKTGLCDYCIKYAKLNVINLIEYLQKRGFSQIETVFSGRQGFHVYVFDKIKDFSERNEIVMELRKKKIKIDSLVTTDKKSIVGFPGSLQAYSMKQVLPIKNIDKFKPERIGDQID